MATELVVVTISPFGDNYTSVLMVHYISKILTAPTSQRATKTQQRLINTSMGAVAIFATVKRKTMPDGVVQTEK